MTVDKPGVVLVGVCVYGGGGIHEYELEVLADDVSDIIFYNILFIVQDFLVFLQLLSLHPLGADRAPGRLSTYSQVDVPGAGEGHLQH